MISAIDFLTEERKTELENALDVILNSEEIAEEFENANHHSALMFLEEIADSLCVHRLSDSYENEWGDTVRECLVCGKEVVTWD